MPTMERAAGRSAPYGQACLGCFKTKCKCIPRLEGNGCERCHRLKRACHPAYAQRRRTDKQPSSSDARIAKLEGTIGQLVSLLQEGNVNVGILGIVPGDKVEQQQHQPQQSQQPEQPQVTPLINLCQDKDAEGTEEGGTVGDSHAVFIDEDGDDADADAIGASTSWWAMDIASGFSASVNGNPLETPQSSAVSDALMSSPASVSSASISLDIFRSRMLHHFPFVHLPAQLPAEHLRLNRPFLFRAITCVTSKSAEEKRASSLELKRVLCETTFLQRSPPPEEHQSQHQTVDLLLGLLVYIAWGWDHLLSRRSLSRLMVVAMSLVGELRFLDQAVPEITRTISHLEPEGNFGDLYGAATATTPTTTTATGAEVTDTQLYLERQRAILGCFVLGSAVSAYFSQVDAPRWMPQMDEGLAAITARGNRVGAECRPECPSDATLAIQVRLQLLTMKAAQVRERAQLPDQPPPETLPSSSLIYIKELLGQLLEIRATLPPAFQHHFVLLAQTYYAEMCIIETVHTKQSTHPPSPTCGPSRLSCLWQLALAINSCTSTFLTLSPSGLLGVPFIQWAQLARCVATLHQLSTLQEPGWDPATVRTLVDLPVLLACVAEKLELAAAEAGEQPEPAKGVFTQLARGLRMFKSSAYHDEGLVAQRGETRRVTKAGDGAGARADAIAGANIPTGTPADASAYGQAAGDLMSPTSWLDQFFVNSEDQTMSTL